MTRFVICLTAFVASAAHAQTTPDLCARLEIDRSNVETFDPATFAPGPNVDVYHLIFTNASSEPVTSMDLSLPGPFIKAPGGQRYWTELPFPSGPNLVARSFFLVDEMPSAGAEIPYEGLEGRFLREVLPGTTSHIAVLSVVTGFRIDTTQWSGSAMSGGAGVPIEFSAVCVPEPSGVFLVGAAAAITVAVGKRREANRHLPVPRRFG
ncbi:MAG: hypothetical protein AAF266_11665 [Planctomycetota bacterium]